MKVDANISGIKTMSLIGHMLVVMGMFIINPYSWIMRTKHLSTSDRLDSLLFLLLNLVSFRGVYEATFLSIFFCIFELIAGEASYFSHYNQLHCQRWPHRHHQVHNILQ